MHSKADTAPTPTGAMLVRRTMLLLLPLLGATAEVVAPLNTTSKINVADIDNLLRDPASVMRIFGETEEVIPYHTQLTSSPSAVESTAVTLLQTNTAARLMEKVRSPIDDIAGKPLAEANSVARTAFGNYDTLASCTIAASDPHDARITPQCRSECYIASRLTLARISLPSQVDPAELSKSIAFHPVRRRKFHQIMYVLFHVDWRTETYCRMISLLLYTLSALSDDMPANAWTPLAKDNVVPPSQQVCHARAAQSDAANIQTGGVATLRANQILKKPSQTEKNHRNMR